MMTVPVWPTLNAGLNATSAVLLFLGWRFIRANRIGLHTLCMMVAFGVSALFLTSYLLYHAQVGSVHFTGSGWVRPLYFTILISHTTLAVGIVPLVLRTLFLAVKRRFVEHRRLARWALPLWFYVSVTGVVVYLLLYCGAATACPNCSDAMSTPGRAGLAKGYFWSILTMMSAPFLIMSAVTFLIIHAYRRRARSSITNNQIPITK